MADSRAKIAWEQENVLKISIKINRNQDPDLYQALSDALSKSSMARDLMNIGLRHYAEYRAQEK